MLDQHKIGSFLAERRRERGMTQQQLAERLHVSFQAVSKWETGAAYPNIELLDALAQELDLTVDEVLAGRKREAEQLSYRKAGVDVAYTDAIKQEMAGFLQSEDPRVLNGLGPFASLYDLRFPELERPVLVLKSEEPGTKQKLALEYGYTGSICRDLVNHLVNDIAVMGAKPLAVLDTIICGSAEKDTIRALVGGISQACRENGCSLVGGETSIQPQVLERGTYVLTASIAGIAERACLVDGSAIREGDAVLALASNGPHTNGYSLIRLLMERKPQIKLERLEGIPFLEQIMKPHTAYYPTVKKLFGRRLLHGMAHITGGGIRGNLSRIVPPGLCARIELPRLQPLPVFDFLRRAGELSDTEMLNTFNCGAGLLLVVSGEESAQVMEELGPQCYLLGGIGTGESRVELRGRVHWA